MNERTDMDDRRAPGAPNHRSSLTQAAQACYDPSFESKAAYLFLEL